MEVTAVRWWWCRDLICIFSAAMAATMKGGATCAVIVIADLKAARRHILSLGKVIANLEVVRRRILAAAGKEANGELRNSWIETT